MGRFISRHTVVLVVLVLELVTFLFFGGGESFDYEVFFMAWAAMGLLLLIISFNSRDSKLWQDALTTAKERQIAREALRRGDTFHITEEEMVQEQEKRYRWVYVDYLLFTMLNAVAYMITIQILY